MEVFSLNFDDKSDFIFELAWEPSVAQGTHSYFRRLPALGLKLRFSQFSTHKS